MKMGKKVKNFIAIVIMGCALVTSRPVHAWIWPTIDLTQISTFVSKISQSISQVTTATAQIENYTATIHAIGDQVSAIAKYVTDLKNEIVKIISLVNDIMSAISYGVHTMDSILKDIEAQVFGLEEQESEIADEVAETIEDEIDNEDYNEEDAQKTLDEGLQQTKKIQEETADAIKKAKETIGTITQQANESVDKLMGSILKDAILSEEKQNEIKQEAEGVRTQINNLQTHADEVLSKMEKNLSETNKTVIDAYTEYSKGIEDYYAQKITREDLTAKGKQFKETIASLDTVIDKDELNSLYEEADSVINAVDNLKDNIANSIANNKDYSDEDDNEKQESTSNVGNNHTIDKKIDLDKNINPGRTINPGKTIKPGIKLDETISINKEKKINKTDLIHTSTHTTYVFNFHSTKTHQHAKGIAKKLKTGYYGVDQDFLLSKELVCDKSAKVDDLADNPEKGMEWFKDCVIKAKIEKEYWCPKAQTEKEIAKCDPFKLSNGLYKKKYRNEGVYKHLTEDYSMANIVGLNKIKQFASTWQDLNDKKSTLSTLQDQFDKVDNTRNAYSLQGIIDLEAPQLLSRLRRVDALERSKNVINFFSQQPTLFLDGRPGNEDYSDAQKAEPGNLDVDVGDGETEEKTLISHMLLYMCDLSAGDISVSSNEADKAGEAEQKIKDCLFKYVNLATRGGEVQLGNIEDENTSGAGKRSRDDVMREWRANEIKALTDSMFHTLYMATVNNFRSSKDYAKLSGDDVNIISLQKGLKNAKEARDDYSAGAETNYYAARQLLTIVDADAQSLQTEIIKDIATMSYNFFDTEAEDEGEK